MEATLTRARTRAVTPLEATLCHLHRPLIRARDPLFLWRMSPLLTGSNRPPATLGATLARGAPALQALGPLRNDAPAGHLLLSHDGAQEFQPMTGWAPNKTTKAVEPAAEATLPNQLAAHHHQHRSRLHETRAGRSRIATFLADPSMRATRSSGELPFLKDLAFHRSWERLGLSILLAYSSRMALFCLLTASTPSSATEKGPPHS